MDDPILWSLIVLQVFMGAFDTLFHHEGTERLAWRPSQKQELRLHGIRNLFYALIFICFGWFEPHGLFTVALVLVLLVEVLITLWDFVEEDLTRKLPASERINHTLLALNYGAILALASPYLFSWSQLETAIYPANYGWWSVFATVSALGVCLFGLRDLSAASRCDRLRPIDASSLLTDISSPKRFLITGGTGFIGTRLINALTAQGHFVTVLTRHKVNAEHLACPLRVVTDLMQIQDEEKFDVFINLAGDPVANGLWSPAKREKIISSRVSTTRGLVDLCRRLKTRPACFISGSAIGWYGLSNEQVFDELSHPNQCFVHDVCQAWEAEAFKIRELGVRLVTLRLGLVLGNEGGILARLLTPFEFGLGGPMGSGEQWMSWIALDDVVRIIGYVIANGEIEGTVNATAPIAVTNKAFTKALGRSLHRPTFFRIPASMLELALGDLARETMLGGQKVTPQKLTKAGFEFKFTDIDSALSTITGST